MKLTYLLVLMFVLSSCDFNINDKPGPQMSFTIKESKAHETFICNYYVKNNLINGVSIKEIFLEKKFWRDNGILLKKKIDCCESQLVIVASRPFSDENNGFNKQWTIRGYDEKNTFIISRDFKTAVPLDSISLPIVKIHENGEIGVINNISLYKTK